MFCFPDLVFDDRFESIFVGSLSLVLFLIDVFILPPDLDCVGVFIGIVVITLRPLLVGIDVMSDLRVLLDALLEVFSCRCLDTALEKKKW